MFDGADAGEDSALHSFRAVRVRGGGHAQVLRHLDDGGEFLRGELRAKSVLGQTENPAGGGHLDAVRAFLVTLPDGFAGVVGSVDHGFLGTRVAGELAVQSIALIRVASGNGDGSSGGDDAWAFQDAFVDRLLQPDNLFTAQIAHGSESRQQRGLGVSRGPVGVVLRIQHGLVAKGGGRRPHLEMDVHVEEARQDRAVLQVDHLVADRSGFVARFNRGDPVAGNDQRHFNADFVRTPVDQPSAMQQGVRPEQ